MGYTKANTYLFQKKQNTGKNHGNFEHTFFILKKIAPDFKKTKALLH